MRDFDPDRFLDVCAYHEAEVSTYDPDAWAQDMDARLGWKEPEPPPVVTVTTSSTCTDTLGRQQPAAKPAAPPKPEAAVLTEQLEQFAEWLSPSRLDKASVHNVGMRVLALLWIVNRGACREMRQRELAERIGCTRAAISWNVCKLARSLGIRVRGMRSETTAEANRTAAHRTWRKRKAASGE
jgi:hypothetical protein